MTNILIVEDDKPSSLILKQLLEKSGYSVTDIVETGEEALEAILKSSPDLVLMDISLAGKIDGIETAERIYSSHNIPFIYITAGTDTKTFERVKRSHPLNYIVKPLNSKMLNSAIEIALYNFNLESRLKQSEESRLKILESIPDKIFEIKGDCTPVSQMDDEIFRELWPPEIAARAVPFIEKSLKENSIEIFDFEIEREKTYFYESRIIRAGADRILVITRDISRSREDRNNLSIELNRMEDAFREKTKDLEKINNALFNEIDRRSLIEEEIQLFKDIIDQSADIMLIIDRKGIVQYSNNSFSKISGYSKDELIGLDVNKIPNPVVSEESILEEVRKLDFWKGETYHTNKTGELYYLDTTISKIKDEKGRVTHIIINAEDITDRKKDEIALEKIRNTVKNSASDSIDKDMAWQTWKEKMLSRNISRTDRSIFSNINNSFTQGAGFGTLITFMEMMGKSPSDANGHRIVDATLFNEAMKNVKIAQDAFKIFAGIDWVISNKIETEETTVREIYTLIKGIISKYKRFAELNKHRIVINDMPTALKNRKLCINPQYFSEAISELIINALKFSRSATNIIILVYSHNNTLRVSVINDPVKGSDGTVGIPEEYEKVVFEPFYRLSKLVHERYNTLDFGIGLTFVEKIVTRHGGEIFAENIVDYSDITKDPQIKVNFMISLPFSRE